MNIIGIMKEKNNLVLIEKVKDLRERKVADIWIQDFNDFAKKQLEDFNYKLTNGENLNEVQTRNINAYAFRSLY